MAAQRMREALDGGHDWAAVLQHFVSSLSAEEEAALHQLLDPEV
jgi:hypothetical protein